MYHTSIQSIILAAGKSSRFNTGRSKLVEKICGQEMILYSTSLFEELAIPTTVVLGHQADEIQSVITKKHGDTISFVYQHEQRGTGHALFCTKDTWNSDHILVINGDMPLVTKDIIQQLISKHLESNATVSFVISHNEDPLLTGYGRIVRDGHKIRIVESKEFQGSAQEHCCVNAGIYIFARSFLENPTTIIPVSTLTSEYYLTDLIKIANDRGLGIETSIASFDRIRGVNTFKELWTAEQIKRSELIAHWMSQGVRFYAAQATYLDINVSIGSGSSLGTGVHLLNGTKIGNNCTIEAFSILDNVTSGNNVTIYSHSVIKDSTLEDNVHIGPFAHIRQHSKIENRAAIGNFVEVKKSSIGQETKIKHLSYIGDAKVGDNVNIGAGTITCNYDGKAKHETIIEDKSFIGSNNTLVAPITIGKNSYTAAGSVLTESVPAHALAFGRARQVNKENYVPLLQEEQKESNNTEPEKPINTISFFGALKTNNDSQTL